MPISFTGIPGYGVPVPSLGGVKWVPPKTPTAPPVVSPAVTPVVTGIDPNELANATYGKPIVVSALGKARIGTAGIIFGPYIEGNNATFAVSFGVPADPAGTRAIYEIAFDSKVAWADAAGFGGAGTPISGFTAETFTFRFKQGTLTQGADALETEKFGVEAVAYRPQMILFIEDLPLAQFGNKLPYVAALIGDTTAAADPDDGINLGEALERFAWSPWVDMSSATFETTGITDVVGGMIVAQDSTTFLDLCQNIGSVYLNLDIIQTDKLRVIDRGAPGVPDITLDRDSLTGEVTFEIQESSTVPRELELITIDPDADYTLVPSKAQRPREPVAVSASVGKETVNLPLIMDAPTRQALVAYAKYAQEQARKRVTCTAMAFGLEIEPGDRIELADLGGGYDDELFRVIDTVHGADYTVEIVAESILNCALPAAAAAEHVQCYEASFAATSTHTFVAVDLGDADADRHIVAAINLTMALTGQTITAVTIDGISATQVVAASNTGQGAISALWSAAVPSDATGDVVVTCSGNFTEISLHVYRLVTALYAVSDTDSDEATTAGAVTVDVDIPVGGIAIAVGMARQGAGLSWTGATSDCQFENDVVIVGTKASASYRSSTGETAFAIAIAPTSIDRLTIAAASFVL